MTLFVNLVEKVEDAIVGEIIDEYNWANFVLAVHANQTSLNHERLTEMPACHLKKSLWRSAVQGVYSEEDTYGYSKELAWKASAFVIDAICFSRPEADPQEILFKSTMSCLMDFSVGEEVQGVIERFMEPMVEHYFASRGMASHG